MVTQHPQLNGCESEQTLGDAEGQGSLGCCSPWGHKESDTTQRLNNKPQQSNILKTIWQGRSHRVKSWTNSVRCASSTESVQRVPCTRSTSNTGGREHASAESLLILLFYCIFWFKIGKGVRQDCILSPCLFNLYAEYIMRNTGLEETQTGIKILFYLFAFILFMQYSIDSLQCGISISNVLLIFVLSSTEYGGRVTGDGNSLL